MHRTENHITLSQEDTTGEDSKFEKKTKWWKLRQFLLRDVEGNFNEW